MFAAAIFDMDGLLLDTERSIMRAWLATAEAHGVDLNEGDYLQVVGHATPESSRILAGFFGSLERVEAARVEVHRVFHAAYLVPGYGVKSGAPALLEALRQRGVRCAVASSSRRSEVEARLATAGLIQHFEAWAGGDEVPRAKPDPAVYRLAASRLGLDPADCIAFEDSRPGATAALASGAQVVIVPDLLPPTPELAAASLHVMDRLDHALPHVPTWFPQIKDAA